MNATKMTMVMQNTSKPTTIVVLDDAEWSALYKSIESRIHQETDDSITIGQYLLSLRNSRCIPIFARTWLLDQTGIETEFCSVMAMGAGEMYLKEWLKQNQVSLQ